MSFSPRPFRESSLPGRPVGRPSSTGDEPQNQRARALIASKRYERSMMPHGYNRGDYTPTAYQSKSTASPAELSYQRGKKTNFNEDIGFS
jgi:hypothetical protein